MKAILLLGLCALALAKIPSADWEREHWKLESYAEDAFRAGKEYRFKYDAMLATGIPGTSKQHAASRIQALASIVFSGEHTATLELQQVRVGRLNERIANPRAIVPFMAFEEVELDKELEAKLKAPLRFTYRHGLVSELVMDGAEETWSANIKRGVLNMLQVNLRKAGITSQSEMARISAEPAKTLDERQDFFTAMEPTLEGLCETVYTVVSEPRFESRAVLNVTKSIDFEKCQTRPSVKYNWRFEDPCPTCEPKFAESEKFLKASTLARFNISGSAEKFMIESAVLESQYTFIPMDRESNMMLTYVNQSLVLLYCGAPKKAVRELRNPKESASDLTYSLAWDMEKEEMFMEGEEEFLRDTPYSQLKNKAGLVQQILRRLVADMTDSVKEEAPRMYLRLVKLFRMLKASEIQEVHAKFYAAPESFTPEQHKKIRELLVDALCDAATKDTIAHVVEKIMEKEIAPMRAAISIKQLVNTRVVSKPMIEKLMQLAESEVCAQNWFLKQSVYLTLGSMVNALCAENADKLALESRLQTPNFCPIAYQKELVEKIFKKYESARSFEDKVIFLKTIGNMGLEPAVTPLEKIIKSVEMEEKTALRVEAVLALRQIRHTMPLKVQQILMPIFMNRRLPTELRIAASYQILNTLPARPVLDQMARKLFSERNRQVAAFVYSQMLTLANATSPCLKTLARDLQLSLRHGRRIGYAFYPSYSKLIVKDFHSERLRAGLTLSFGSVFSEKSGVPKTLAVGIHSSFLGMWAKNLLGFGVVASDMDALLHKYLSPKGLWNEMDLEEILVRAPRSAATNGPAFELSKLWKSLKTVARELPNTPEGFVYLRYKDQDFGFIPFNLKTMTESLGDFVSEGRVSMRQIERFLESGYNVHLYKAALLHEMSYKIPTTIGMPLVMTVKIPTVFQLTGQIKAEIKEKWESVKLQIRDAQPSGVVAIVADMQAWSPLSNAGLKVVAIAKTHVPITAAVEMDLTNPEKELKITYEIPQTETQWLHLETRPVTYTRVWPKTLQTWQEPHERTIVGEQSTRIYNFEQDFPLVRRFERFCEESLGLQLKLTGFWHHTPAMRLRGTPFCALAGVNKLAVRTLPGSETPEKIVATVAARLFNELSSELRFGGEQEAFRFLEEEEPEWELEKFSAARHQEHSLKVKIGTVGGKKLEAELETTLKCEAEARLCRFRSEFVRAAVPAYDSQSFKICMESEYLYPKNVHRFADLGGKKIVASMKTTWGRSCAESGKHITIKAVAEPSRAQREMLESEPEFRYAKDEQECAERPETCSPIATYNSLVKAARLHAFKIQADYEGVAPIVKNVTAKIFRAIKTYYYWSSEEDSVDVENPRGRIAAKITLDPRSAQYINVTVKAPRQNVIFRDIPLRYPIRPMSLKRTSTKMTSFSGLMESLGSVISPVCHAGSRRIQTFDGVEYAAPISTCYSVLAKDCSAENFAVLIKKMSEESEQKKVKIITKYAKIELEPTADAVKVFVDGEEVANLRAEEKTIEDHGHVVARIEKMEDGSVKVVLPERGIRVYFDGYACNIKASRMLRGIQCGLCGHYDGESETEFFTPEKMEEEEDVRAFFQRYTIKESGCRFPEQREQICDGPDCRIRRPYVDSAEEEERSIERFEDISGEKKFTEEEYYMKGESRPVRRTKIVEQAGKICFSKAPVPVCPHNAYPAAYEKKAEQVEFACLSRDHLEVDGLMREVREERERTPARIAELPVAFSEKEKMPKTCIRY